MTVDGKLDDETLMRYLDGELDRDEARHVERALAVTPELQAKASALGQLHDVLGARFQHAQEEAEPRLDALWDKIRGGLQEAAAPVPRRPSLRETVRDWFESYRSHVVTGALAAAAGALIATFAAGRNQGVVERYVDLPPASSVLLAAAPAEVESLDVEDGNATILQIPGDREDDPSTTVVWITPNDEGPI